MFLVVFHHTGQICSPAATPRCYTVMTSDEEEPNTILPLDPQCRHAPTQELQ